jgi:CRISPR/Cas system-associated exonuclease Cas4 (RecB family)
VLFDDDETEAALAEKGAQMIVAFAQKVPLPSVVLGIEQRFTFGIIDPEASEVLPIPFVGSIDAVVKEAELDPNEDGRNTTSVWELKTGTGRWDENRLLYDFQPTAYRIAAREAAHATPALKVIVTTKTKKPDVQIARLVRSRRDEEELMMTASSVYRALEAGCEHPVRGWQCKTCPFAAACS